MEKPDAPLSNLIRHALSIIQFRKKDKNSTLLADHHCPMASRRPFWLCFPCVSSSFRIAAECDGLLSFGVAVCIVPSLGIEALDCSAQRDCSYELSPSR